MLVLILWPRSLICLRFNVGLDADDMEGIISSQMGAAVDACCGSIVMCN